MFKFFAYSNLFISFCVAAFTLQTYVVINVSGPFYWQLILINGLCTFFVYNIQRLYFASNIDTKNYAKYEWYNKNKKWIFTLMILFAGSFFVDIFIFLKLNTAYIFYYLILGVISIFYFLNPVNLRRIGVLKPVIISLVFVVCGILIPVNFNVNNKIAYYLLAQFFLITTLCLLFDIRDNTIDNENKLHTLPNIIGIKLTKYVALSLIMIYGVFQFLFNNSELKLDFLLIVFITVIAILFATEKRHNFYYLYLVDGVILLQFVAFATL